MVVGVSRLILNRTGAIGHGEIFGTISALI